MTVQKGNKNDLTVGLTFMCIKNLAKVKYYDPYILVAKTKNISLFLTKMLAIVKDHNIIIFIFILF